MKKLPAQPVHGLIDGMRVLQTLTLSAKALSTLELAEMLHMEKTKVNRVLKTLDHMELAYRTKDRKYMVGSGIHILAAQGVAASGLIQMAVKQLATLKPLGYTLALGFLAEDQVCYLYHHTPGQTDLDALGKWMLYPVEKSSIGVALLAQKDEDYIQAVHAKVVQRGGDVEALHSAVEASRERGVAYVIEAGNTSIALCIGNPVFAAIALSGEIEKSTLSLLETSLKNVSNTIHENLNALK